MITLEHIWFALVIVVLLVCIAGTVAQRNPAGSFLCGIGLHRWWYSGYGRRRYCAREGCACRQVRDEGGKWRKA